MWYRSSGRRKRKSEYNRSETKYNRRVKRISARRIRRIKGEVKSTEYNKAYDFFLVEGGTNYRQEAMRK